MLNCQQVSHLCSEEQDRPLSIGEQLAVGMHTVVCTGCNNYRKQMKFLRETAQRYAAGAAVVDRQPPEYRA